MGITVEELLAGPRGRLLCLNLALAWEETQAQAAAASAARSLVAAPVCPVRLPLSDAVWQADAALDPDPRGSSYNLPYPEENRALALEDIDAAWAQPLAARRRARQDAEALIATAARACQSIAARVPLPGTLLWALADTAGAARGWQAPAGIDVLLAQPALVSALRPVAQAVTNSPAVDWWSRGMDPPDQWIELQESDGSAWSWRLRGNIRKVWDEWAQHRAEEEAEGFSSTGWTSPVTFGQDSPPITHGTLPSAACDASGAPAERPHGDAELAVAGTPTGFLIQEDSGPVGPLMQAGRLLPQAAPRVLEIDSEAAWVSACTAFPLDVSRSYGPQARLALYLVDEPRATTWVIPDWGKAAREYDAVHLTVGAYLACATRPIEVPGHGFSAITGWDPDETYWLRFPPEQEPPSEANGRLRTWSEAGGDEWRDITRGPTGASR
ncbi:hypothetical protein DWB68_00980 [Galactobacter valiniphilus]|uniref:Uncharacterized protein n=1 Tax=Galactobacter valiniphilus TaxID=2676122 RepID=A0A399JH13_9MICC|nr:hypothetical protein [Galactobacter valiniphilus]RII43519.1 hypothetical protein DWB68_00980 [Galactobacter valiniphilus]